MSPALCLVFSLLASLNPAAAAPIDDARKAIEAHVSDPQTVDDLVVMVTRQGAATQKTLGQFGQSDGISERLAMAVAANLSAKATLDPPLIISAAAIQRTVIGYEAFKLQCFVTSGVFPKRYFGYFDGRYDTAPYEARLQHATRAAVEAINGWQASRNKPLRLTEAEVSITWLAEGGAIHLLHQQQFIEEGFHPVMDVGLDDIAMGVADYPDLMRRIDEEGGTNLRGLVGWWTKGEPSLSSSADAGMQWLKHANGDDGPHAILLRNMTFEEAIAGTALMVLWEKEIAARKMVNIGVPPLHTRPLDEQFVITSLVYNSGILHKPARWQMIRSFDAGHWIWGASESNKTRRWALNVLAPSAGLTHLRAGGAYPEQPTAWLAGYHILQRFGAYEAMMRFTDVFDETGSFTRLLPLVLPAVPDEQPVTDKPDAAAQSTSSATGWPLTLLFMALLAGGLALRRALATSQP